MSQAPDLPAPASVLTLWFVASALAACETALTFAAPIGVNWSLLVLFAAGTMCFIQPRSAAGRSSNALALLTVLLAIALAITADGGWHQLLFVSLLSTLSVQLMARVGVPYAHSGTTRLLLAPLQAIAAGFRQLIARTETLLLVNGAGRARPLVRGAVLALPPSLVLAALLSNADPQLLAWREAALNWLLSLTMIWRLVVFSIFFTATLGFLGMLLQPAAGPPNIATLKREPAWFTRTDQRLVLGSASVVVSLYLLLQLSHLFGNMGAVPGNHVTYADAVHRGFFELNAAATLAAVLIGLLVRYAAERPVAGEAIVLGLLLLIEAQLLAVSALFRVHYYEAAYGYTMQRLLVQVYAGLMIAGLALLAWELLNGADFLRLARRCWVLAIVTLCAFVCWNPEAWIVRMNIAHYEATDVLDRGYLLYGLGVDALPETVRELETMNAARRNSILQCLSPELIENYQRQSRFDWNGWTLRRAALAKATQRMRELAATVEPVAAGTDVCAYGSH